MEWRFKHIVMMWYPVIGHVLCRSIEVGTSGPLAVVIWNGLSILTDARSRHDAPTVPTNSTSVKRRMIWYHGVDRGGPMCGLTSCDWHQWLAPLWIVRQIQLPLSTASNSKVSWKAFSASLINRHNFVSELKPTLGSSDDPHRKT